MNNKLDQNVLEFPDYIPEAVRQEARETPALGYPEHYGVIRRLIQDPRMRYAWELLPQVTTNEDQQRGLFNEAIFSVVDFPAKREEQKEVRAVRNQIIETAQHLASLLERSKSLSAVESELLSIQVLLRHTEGGPELLNLWSQGKHIPDSKYPDGEPPNLVDLLKSFSSLLRLPPRISREPEGIRAAISSRKRSLTWEYLRHLWTHLREMHGFQSSYKLAEILSVTCEVVLELENAPDPNNVRRIMGRRDQPFKGANSHDLRPPNNLAVDTCGLFGSLTRFGAGFLGPRGCFWNRDNFTFPASI